MGDSSSLVFFTIFSQCAAGIMFFLAFRGQPELRGKQTAFFLAFLGAMASLGHLGNPINCVYTVANVGSSWLSREIAMCLAFCASIIASIIWKNRWLTWLCAILGLVFVGVMSMVYIIPTEPAWNSGATFLYFLCSSVLLGGSMLMVVDEFDSSGKNPLLGRMPFWLMVFTCINAIFCLIQLPACGSPARSGAIWHIILLVAGCGLALPFFCKCAVKDAKPDATDDKANWTLPILGITGLIWIAEFCGRVSFYKSYVWFGM